MPSSCAFNWLLAARVLYAYFEARDVADSDLYANSVSCGQAMINKACMHVKRKCMLRR